MSDIEVDLSWMDRDELLALLHQLHEMDVTFNRYVEMALEDRIKRYEEQKEG